MGTRRKKHFRLIFSLGIIHQEKLIRNNVANLPVIARCLVHDVLQSQFSRSTISIAVFCLQNLICQRFYIGILSQTRLVVEQDVD